MSNSASHSPPAKSDKLSRGELAAYGSGIVAHQYPHVAVAQLAMPLFNIGLGLGPAVVGAILMTGRIWEAASNPLIGTLSDNTRTRWGRRRPFIFLGGVLTGLAYPVVWLAPRGWSSDALGVYLLVSTLVLYASFSAFSVPYIALGLELTPDYHERTRVQVWRSYFALVPAFTGGWFYWICQRPIFGDMVTGARWLGFFIGAVIIAASVIPAIFLRERYYAVAHTAQKERFATAIRSVFRNRPFLIMMVVIVSLELGQFTTDHLGFYVLAYHVYGGDMKAAGWLLGVNTTVLITLAFFAIPTVRWAEMRWGKIHTLRLCLLMNFIADALKWVLASPDHPWTWVTINMMTQFGGLGFWILVNSMKADICDWDELASGRRREGSFSAVAGLLQKGTAAITLMLAGLILQLVGFDAAKGGQQDPGTIYWLRVAYSLPSVALLAASIWILKYYPLDGRTMQDVRDRLEKRRVPV